jgi:hypothetical protein
MTNATTCIVQEVEAALTTAERLLSDGLEAKEYDGAIYAAAVAALERARLALHGYMEVPKDD